jgi:hypothetical protein
MYTSRGTCAEVVIQLYTTDDAIVVDYSRQKVRCGNSVQSNVCGLVSIICECIFFSGVSFRGRPRVQADQDVFGR